MIPRTDPHRLVEALAEVARPIIRDHYPDVGACIEATKIGVAVLADVGVPAAPITVQTVAYNPAAAQLLRTNPDGLQAAMAAADPGDLAGPWLVGVGMRGQRPVAQDRWPGHLVIGVRRHGLVVDLTVDQASRPARGMTLGPAVFAVPPDDLWWSGGVTHGFQAGDTGQCVLAVTAHPADMSYRVTPGWRWPTGAHRATGAACTARVLAAVKAALR